MGPGGRPGPGMTASVHRRVPVFMRRFLSPCRTRAEGEPVLGLAGFSQGLP